MFDQKCVSFAVTSDKLLLSSSMSKQVSLNFEALIMGMKCVNFTKKLWQLTLFSDGHYYFGQYFSGNRIGDLYLVTREDAFHSPLPLVE